MVGTDILGVIFSIYLLGILPALLLGIVFNFNDGPKQTLLSWLWIPWFVLYKLDLFRRIKAQY